MQPDPARVAANVCECGHEHTSGRLGSCSKFTCPCNEWRPPGAGRDADVSPKPGSTQPEGVAEGVSTGSRPARSGSAAPTYHKVPWDDFVEGVSASLYEAGLFHSVTKKPSHTLSLNIAGIQTVGSIRDLAVALERADADLTYSAASGFSLFRRPSDA